MTEPYDVHAKLEGDRHRRYREANRDAIRERQRAWRVANRNAVNEQDRQRRAADPEGHRDRKHDYRERLKAQVLAAYGASCACCGTTERLTIDHVNGNGGEHRAALFGHRGGSTAWFWLWLIRNGFPPGYQTLCLLCNQSKGKRARCRRDHGGEGAVR